MIGNESCDFLRENDHSHNEHDGCPEQHRTQRIPFSRAQPRATLLPESNSQQHDGKGQVPGPDLSMVLLGIGFWQQRRARLCSVKRNYLSAVLLWTAVVLVVGLIIFPQEIAGFIADHFSTAAK